MENLILGVSLYNDTPGAGFVEFVWASEWTSSVGTDEGSGSGQQYRGLRVDGGGDVWAAGGLITYNGAASAEEYVSTDALTVTPGPTGQLVNMIAVAHNASDGVHQVATMIGNTNAYARCYAVTHDTVNGYTYIAGRAGEHMETTTGAFQETFQGDTNPNALYGPQDCYIARIITATGVVDKASYFGVSTEGDFIRDLIYHNGYLYAGRAKYGAGTPTIATQLLKIEPDLSDVVATFDFGNTSSTSDGQPALVARGDDLWCYFITTTAVTNGVPTTGAFQETFGTGTHARSYIGKFDISGSGLTFVQGTYIRTLTGTSPLVGATHTIDWVPHNGGSIIMSLGGANSTCDLPTYGTPQYEAAAGPGGNAYFGHISGDLSTMLYGTYLHSDTSSERVANSSIRASRDGKRVLIPIEADGAWDTTDGSSNPGGVGTSRQLTMIFRRTEAGTGWEPEFVHYSELGALYASEFDAAGNAYVAGYLANSGAPIPFLERFTPTVYVPPVELTAPTTGTPLIDGLSSAATTSVTETIPIGVTTGDWLLIAAVHRKDGTLNCSIGTQVGTQASDFANHEMAVWRYQVTGSDVPGTTTFTISSTSTFTNFSTCVVPVTGTGGVDDEAGPGVYGVFGSTATAPAVTTTSTNSRVYCFVSGVTGANYTPQSGAVEVAEATTGTAGLYVFSYLQATIGVAGPLTATIDGGGTANHYGCSIAMKGV